VGHGRHPRQDHVGDLLVAVEAEARQRCPHAELLQVHALQKGHHAVW
jgi:hypothetical protein